MTWDWIDFTAGYFVGVAVVVLLRRWEKRVTDTVKTNWEEIAMQWKENHRLATEAARVWREVAEHRDIPPQGR